jgi:pimeloyl-ACP methyl ester carboxylesterase
VACDEGIRQRCNALDVRTSRLRMSPAIRTGTLFDRAGTPGAPAIVLVHGSVVTRKMWLPQLRGLADGYDVLAPDLPGHGVLSATPFTFEAAVRTLRELIDRETRGTAVVAGISLGGYVAIELAARYPTKVAGLILSGSSVNFTGVLGLYLKCVGGLMRRGWLKQSTAQAEARTRRMFPARLAADADAQVQAGVYPESLGAAFAGMAGRDFAERLSTYPGPVLILNGERDSTSRRSQAKFMARLRHARAQVIPGAGHACNLDQPEAYNEAVRAFAASLRLPGAGA